MKADQMPLNHALFEKVRHGTADFPIQYYVDELHDFLEQTVPLHWHFEPQFYVAKEGAVQVRIGNRHVVLQTGDGIFINGNTLHGFKQVDEQDHCRCPHIIFSSELIAPSSSLIFQKYVKPLLSDKELPFFVLSAEVSWQREILSCLFHIFDDLQRYGPKSAYGSFPLFDFDVTCSPEKGFEMRVQNELNRIWQQAVAHFDQIPKVDPSKKDLDIQIRLQLMISHIEKNFMNVIKLEDIASAASVSRSEASRLFNLHMECSPIEFLILYRIEIAKRLLVTTPRTVQEVAFECGFNTPSYFIKLFKKHAGMTPKQYKTR